MFQFLVLIFGLLALFLVPLTWFLVSSVRKERAHKTHEQALLHRGIRAQATVIRMGPVDAVFGHSFDIVISHQGSTWQARVTQVMTRHIAAGFHPGRSAWVSFSPEQPTDAVFDLRAMGYDVQ